MRRRIIVLLCVVAMAALALASCDEGGAAGGGHTHTYSSTWSSNETEHWYPATCEHGENKGSLAAHADADEDGVCDVCQYEVGHTHSYASEWSTDENNHWKAATCTHTAEKGELALHTDEEKDGECDVCKAHTHVFDGVAFCEVCGEIIADVDETNVEALVKAVVVRKNRIVGGKIRYNQVANSKSYIGTSEEKVSITQVIDYQLGENGSYYKNTSTGGIMEKWIYVGEDDSVSGITAMSDLSGKVINAEPSSFSLDDKNGYYYTVSTLADGHGAEAVLAALLEDALNANIASNYVELANADENTFAFSFNALVVQETTIAVGDVGSTVYNANYYEVTVSFAYTDNFELTSLNIVCDCWTNDAGENTEADIDFTYHPDTGMVWEEDPWKDTYTFVVEQTAGVRSDISVKDTSVFTPTDIVISEDASSTEAAESITVTVGDFSKVLYINCAPEGTFVRFLTGLTVRVLNEYGRVSRGGLQAYISEGTIVLTPTVAGKYQLEVTSGDITKTVNVTVENENLDGEYTLELTASDNNAWVGPYNFIAEKTGTYTFYCPSYGVGIWEKSAFEKADGLVSGNQSSGEISYDGPFVDYQDPFAGSRSFSINLEAGEVFSFYYMLVEKNQAFTIGYDIVE